MTAININQQTIPFSKTTYKTIPFHTMDTSKLSLVKVKDDKSGLFRFFLTYDYSLFIMEIGDDDSADDKRFYTYGLKKCTEYDGNIKKFTDVWNGEYEFGIKMISAPIPPTSTNACDYMTAHEKKLKDVLDAMREAIAEGLMAFDEIRDGNVVSPLYSQTRKKGPDGLPIKSKGTYVADQTKSYNLNCKCKSKLVNGLKYTKGMKIRPEDREIDTFINSFSMKELKPELILGKHAKGVFFMVINEVKIINSTVKPKLQVNRALLQLLVNSTPNIDVSKYTQKYATMEMEEEDFTQE